VSDGSQQLVAARRATAGNCLPTSPASAASPYFCFDDFSGYSSPIHSEEFDWQGLGKGHGLSRARSNAELKRSGFSP